MTKVITLQEYYRDYFPTEVANKCVLSPQMGHFNVFERTNICKRITQIHRGDFYKIALVIGTGILHLEDTRIEVKGRALVFYNPSVPHLWESVSEQQAGYFCLFNNHFIAPTMADNNFRNSPLFNINLNPVYHLTIKQTDDLVFIFKKMMQEVESDYVHKYDALSHYIHIILHEVHKMQPSNLASEKYLNASSRISSLFVELLERQFPVDFTEQAIKLKTPHDFADKLAIHVNHLNRAVKDVTGRSTTEIISARIANEAKALLKHTDYTISEIAYSLGFEHPSNFNIFFKKHTNKTPKSIRSKV